MQPILFLLVALVFIRHVYETNKQIKERKQKNVLQKQEYESQKRETEIRKKEAIKTELWPWPKTIKSVNGKIPIWVSEQTYRKNESLFEPAWGINGKHLLLSDWGKLYTARLGWLPVWVNDTIFLDNSEIIWHPAIIQVGGKLPDFTNKTLQQAATIIESYKSPSLPSDIKSIHIPVNESEFDKFVNDINKAIMKYAPELIN